MKLSGDDRVKYLYALTLDVDPNDTRWYDGECWNSVVVDTKTGIAFTTHNHPGGYAIPRIALAEMIDEGFEP